MYNYLIFRAVNAALSLTVKIYNFIMNIIKTVEVL